MGIRGATNAVSYFKAKALDPNVGLHGGCGPIAMGIARNGYMALISFALQPLVPFRTCCLGRCVYFRRDYLRFECAGFARATQRFRPLMAST
jgi:hypothetical protein